MFVFLVCFKLQYKVEEKVKQREFQSFLPIILCQFISLVTPVNNHSETEFN